MIVKLRGFTESGFHESDVEIPDNTPPEEIHEALGYSQPVHSFSDSSYPFSIDIFRGESDDSFLVTVVVFGAKDYFGMDGVYNLMRFCAMYLGPFVMIFHSEHFFKALKSLQQQGSRPGQF
jgi:hypothetical protein